MIYFELNKSILIILTIQFIRFYDIKCDCLAKNVNRSLLTTRSKVLTSFQFSENVNDVVSKTVFNVTMSSTITFNDQSTPITTIITTTTTTMIYTSTQSASAQASTTWSNNQIATYSPTVPTTTLTKNPYKCKTQSNFVFYLYLQLDNNFLLQYSKFISSIRQTPTSNTNIMCTCASYCGANCDYFVSINSMISNNCYLYQLKKTLPFYIQSGVFFVSNFSVSCGFKKSIVI